MVWIVKYCNVRLEEREIVVDPELVLGSWRALLGSQLTILWCCNNIFFPLSASSTYLTLLSLPYCIQGTWNADNPFTAIFEAHDSSAMLQRDFDLGTDSFCASAYVFFPHLSYGCCRLSLHRFSWLLAIGFFLLVFRILDFGSPCSQENTDMLNPEFPAYE